MKLFNINYRLGLENLSYLTVGTDNDDKESIENRELSSNKWGNNFPYAFTATEISEVDGHKIIIENKDKKYRYYVTYSFRFQVEYPTIGIRRQIMDLDFKIDNVESIEKVESIISSQYEEKILELMVIGFSELK